MCCSQIKECGSKWIIQLNDNISRVKCVCRAYANIHPPLDGILWVQNKVDFGFDWAFLTLINRNLKRNLHRKKWCEYNFTSCTSAASSQFCLYSLKLQICLKEFYSLYLSHCCIAFTLIRTSRKEVMFLSWIMCLPAHLKNSVTLGHPGSLRVNSTNHETLGLWLHVITHLSPLWFPVISLCLLV